MKRAVLEEILRELDGVTSAEGSFSVPEELEVDLLASSGVDVLTIARVRGLALRELHLRVVNEKGVQFFLEYERMLGVRVKSDTSKQKVSRAGFAAD